MLEALKQLLTWDVVWRLFAAVFVTGFALALGMNLASAVFPYRIKKDVTYDNLDKVEIKGEVD